LYLALKADFGGLPLESALLAVLNGSGFDI
jgi:hypothetical protein